MASLKMGEGAHETQKQRTAEALILAQTDPCWTTDLTNNFNQLFSVLIFKGPLHIPVPSIGKEVGQPVPTYPIGCSASWYSCFGKLT